MPFHSRALADVLLKKSSCKKGPKPPVNKKSNCSPKGKKSK